MQSYLLPSNSETVSFECTLGNSETTDPIFGFDHNLNKLKDAMGNIDPRTWNKNIRKETNTWEDGTKPLNRAALKFDEIVKEYGLFKLMPKDPQTFICLCEGPGGFMECILKRRCVIDNVVGITLKPEEKNTSFVPDWKINDNRISVQYGADGTGNLYKTENIIHFWNNVSKSLFVTADGGFDVSPHWNRQEQISSKLIWCQIVTAMGCQSENVNSVFVLKMFDTFTVLSAKMLYILSIFYNSVNICKPKKSRESNSERYIVCIGFKGILIETMNNFLGIINGWNNDTISDICIQTIIPQTFIESLTKINWDICQKQIKHLKENIKKCSK